MGSRALLSIGLISDTHNRIHPRIKDLFREVDEIWHLGDVCEQVILDELRRICPRLVAIRGNNDHDLDLPPTLTLERGGETFRLIHIPPKSPPDLAGWLLCGHTHVPRSDVQGSVRWFNPGSAGLANKGAPLSAAFLTKKGKEPFQSTLVRL